MPVNCASAGSVTGSTNDLKPAMWMCLRRKRGTGEGWGGRL
jgi:hypothetical protein